jgi:hypothetical protein
MGLGERALPSSRRLAFAKIRFESILAGRSNAAWENPYLVAPENQGNPAAFTHSDTKDVSQEPDNTRKIPASLVVPAL